MSASLENAGVCILSATAPQPQVDAAGLRAKGLRVRTVSTCVADVLLASASLAMLVIPSADLHPGTAGAERQWDRCHHLTASTQPLRCISELFVAVLMLITAYYASLQIRRRRGSPRSKCVAGCQSLSQKGFRSALVIVHGPSSPQLQASALSARPASTLEQARYGI